MKTVGLIGLGKIVEHYVRGLKASAHLRLCAVADMDAAAVSRTLYAEYPFFTDYREMLAAAKPEAVIISTPPGSHFQIARYCLEHSTDVIIEKPVTLCMEDFDSLMQIAEDNGRLFQTLFHWQGARELADFTERYPAESIRAIRISVEDPYSADGVMIDPSYRALGGAWFDSGVNALSMLRMWLPFDEVQIVGTQAVYCRETGLPLSVTAQLCIDGVEAAISVDWRNGKNHKQSLIILEDRTVLVNHSDQRVVDGTSVTEYARMPRLDEHYYQLFGKMDGTSNGQQSRSIHRVLMEVQARL